MSHYNYLSHSSSFPVNALLLVGGKSSRMGRDKSNLNYGYEKDTEKNRTIDRLHSLLEKTEVSKIYVSCRKDQQNEAHLKKYSLLFDDEEWMGRGPMTGILSAFKKEMTSWLVIACDLPHIEIDTLFLLFSLRCLNREKNRKKLAYTYFNRTHHRLEPLCTLYEPDIYDTALVMMSQGDSCPQKLLWSVEKEIEIIPLLREEQLDNINTPEDFDRAKKVIQETF